MSNLSNIGFPVNSAQDCVDLENRVVPLATSVPANGCKYLWYHDKSGAELWIQVDEDGQLISANPHFYGESRRRVCLESSRTSATHKLNGSLYGWADPLSENDPESGEYPFAFDVPDFLAIPEFPFPRTVTIQLAAFPITFYCYRNAETFDKQQEKDLKLGFKVAARSFIPLDPTEQAFGIFAGEVKTLANKTNVLTGQPFIWMLVETLGGEVDVVVDPRLLTAPPTNGNIVAGEFWLSGRLIL
jgi:hypothetical protein